MIEVNTRDSLFQKELTHALSFLFLINFLFVLNTGQNKRCNTQVFRCERTDYIKWAYYKYELPPAKKICKDTSKKKNGKMGRTANLIEQ